MTASDLFDRVVKVAPSFDHVRRDHMAFYRGLLGHILVADLRRFLESAFSGERCEGAVPPTTTEIRNILLVVDRGLAEGDGYTRDMIAVSFVEGMEHEALYGHLKPFLGPRVSEEIVRQRNWRP